MTILFMMKLPLICSSEMALVMLILPMMNSVLRRLLLFFSPSFDFLNVGIDDEL